jgi:fido (protein-threonine AMPylation protein)
MQPDTATTPAADQTAEEKIRQLRELFADAPDIGKRALENVLGELTSQVAQPRYQVESAGRVGVRLGMVSELTMIFPFAPGGARRLRAFLQLLGGNH